MQTKGKPTIGGIVATNTSGPRRISVGACRDFLLGVRFVDGMGRVLKNGGRVMKNVTGYDLVKLMAGSYGTLGVLSEVSLKVLPIAERAATVTIAGLTDVQAVRVMSAALGSPYDVSGAAHSQVGDSAQALTMLRLEGFEGSVTYRAQKLRELLAPFGNLDVVTDDTKVQAMWRRVRDVEGFAAKTGNVWKISVKPSDAPELVARLGADVVMYDWGGGLIWALAPTEIDLRAVMAGTAGHATLVRGEGFAKFHPEPAAVAALSAGIRQKFDPRGFLNPGLMG
jgi:glycolate oxidase FAD binding subunit